MSVQASVVINTVRDLIPDPMYSAAGVALPDADGGLFRAQTLYRFLNDAVKAVAQKIGWVIEDWTAVGTTAHVPTYDIDSKWVTFDSAFCNGWRLAMSDEANLLWPSTIETTQPVIYALHSITDHWNLRLYPAPSTSDPVYVTAGGTMTPTDTFVTLSTVTGMLPYGFITIESELIQYYKITGTVLQGLVRGVGGTTATSHLTNTPVAHLSTWLKGTRMPNEITTSTSVIEVPSAFQYPLQLYVLSRCRQSENEFAEASKLMSEFNKECDDKAKDPRWKQHQGSQVRAYGEPLFGSLTWGHVIVP